LSLSYKYSADSFRNIALSVQVENFYDIVLLYCAAAFGSSF